MVRSPCCEKKGLKRGRWTEEEDEILLKYIQENGEGSWKSLPKNAGLLRCGKSCRLRWINYLRDGLKRGNISKEEEEIIIQLHSSIGKRWSIIAAHLPGRTDNEIKNYWNSHLSRQVHSFRCLPDGQTVTVNLGSFLAGGKHRRSRNSVAAMKKRLAFPAASVIRKEQSPNGVPGNLSTASCSFTQAEKSSSSLIAFDFNVDEVFYDEPVSAAALQPADGTDASSKEEKPAEVGRGSGFHAMSEMETIMEQDLEELKAKLWAEETGEMWPWLSDLSGMSGYDEDVFSWFRS